jgi:3-oxoacyl-[acyl-carrier-protein] synthase-1
MDGAGQPLRCARDGILASDLFGSARLRELAQSALAEVATKILARGPLGARVRLLLALPDPRPGFGPAEIKDLTQTLASLPLAGDLHLEIATVGGGHAAGLLALEMAVASLAQGREEICIVGGVDGYLDADTLAWLEHGRQIDRKGVRGGFSPGEAAGMMALMTRATRASLRLPSLARVAGVATGREKRSLDSDEGILGEALTEVVRRATAELRLANERVDGIYCDINGERHRADEWAFTLLRAPECFRDGTDYRTAVGSWGDIGAASGVLGCALAIAAWQRRYARGPRSLVWASSPGGLRGAVLLEEGAN